MRFLLTASLFVGLNFAVQANNFLIPSLNSNLNNLVVNPPITLKEQLFEFNNLPEGLTIHYKKAQLEAAPSRLQQSIMPLIDAYTLYLLNIDGKDVPSALQNQIIKKHKAGEQKHIEISYKILYQSADIFSLAIHAYILNGTETQPQKQHTWIINYDMKEHNLIQRKNLFKVSETEVLKQIQKLYEQGKFFDEKGSSVNVFSKAPILPEHMSFVDDDNILLLYQPHEFKDNPTTIKCYIPRAEIQHLWLYK